MGGSFNPAHQGHLYIAQEARKVAQLDEVWWLVSPQNPLKSTQDMAPFQPRLEQARALASPHSWLRCLDIEDRLKLGTSFASLRRIQKLCRRADIIWIMGADNLSQFPRWFRASDIAQTSLILVMNRPDYGWQALASKGAAILGRRHRRGTARTLAPTSARISAHASVKRPGKDRARGWAFHLHTRNRLSATMLRSTKRV